MLDSLRQRLSSDGVAAFSVRVHPGASHTRVKDTLSDGTLKMDIAAVPEDGKANAELIRFLAKEFKVSKSCVEIVSGKLARTKVVKISAAHS